MRTVAALLAIALAGCVTSQPAPVRIAGTVTATVHADGRIDGRAQGCAQFDKNGACIRPLTTDAVMRVASISKLVVALGVMRLVEQGKLDLDRDIGGYLGYRVRNPVFPETPITLRQLLAHTASLHDGEGYRLPLGRNMKDELAVASRWNAQHPPGAYFKYANFNSVVIATVMEAVTGERFDHLMQRLILKPLAIDGCFNWATCSPAAIKRAAILYRSGPDETEWHPNGPWVAQVDDLNGRPPSCPVIRESDDAPCDLATYRPGTNGALFSPQGGLRISILDLTKIARVFMNEGTVDGVRLLKPQSTRAMLRPEWRFDPTAQNGDAEIGTMCAYGLSVQLLNAGTGEGCRDDLFADRRPRIGHLAEAYGLYGGLWVDLAARRAVIYLVTGTSDDPRREQARTSGFTRLEEKIAISLRE